MYDPDRVRRNHACLLAGGRCPRCGGKYPIQAGRKRCLPCAIKESERRHAARLARIAAGECSRCGAPLDRKGKQCVKCYEYGKNRRAAL